MKIANVQSPAPRRAWEELVLADRDVVVEQEPLWIEALQSAGGYRDASRLYRFSDGLSFVLPLVARSTWGPQTGFSPGWGIGGLVGPGLRAEHVTEIVRDLAGARVLLTHVRPNPLQHQAWSDASTPAATAIAKRSHAVDLTGGLDASHARFRPSGRRGLKLANRAGVRVTTHLGGHGLDEYYHRLYEPSLERWAARQHEPVALAKLRARRRDPLDKLQRIANTLGDSFRLYLATVDDELAVGNVVIFGRHNAHATRGAMNYATASKSRASYAADFAAIEDACEMGCRWYQMGESGDNQSLAEYKERFGAEPIEYHEYRIERLPLLRVDRALRSGVKRVIGFRD